MNLLPHTCTCCYQTYLNERAYCSPVKSWQHLFPVFNFSYYPCMTSSVSSELPFYRYMSCTWVKFNPLQAMRRSGITVKQLPSPHSQDLWPYFGINVVGYTDACVLLYFMWSVYTCIFCLMNHCALSVCAGMHNSCFALVVPVTLKIIDSFWNCCDHLFSVPLHNLKSFHRSIAGK